MKLLTNGVLFRCFLIAILTYAILISFPHPAQAAVTLKSFSATYSNGKVSFSWETRNEQDSAGFIINRSTEENGTYIQLPSSEDPIFFIALGYGGIYNASYETGEYNEDGDPVLKEYFDENVIEGNTYWYRLESVDINNNSDYSDPVSVYIGATPTPTNSPTSSYQTENNTVTPSPTSDGSTATITSTSKPTKTKKPGTATPTFTATRYNWTAPTSTPQPPGNNPLPVDTGATDAAQTAEANQSGVTQEVQPTDTLVPLPSVTIVFPTAVVKQPDVADARLADNAKNTPSNSESWLTPQRLIIVAIIAGIWIMLGGWFYLSFKRLDK